MKYVAHARRAGSWWAVEVEGLLGAHTQARRLDQIEAMALDVIVALTDADPREVEVEVQPVLGPTLGPLVTRSLDSRRALAELEPRAWEDTRAAVARLIETGFSTRDTGHLLGISHQRVAQLRPGRRPPVGRRSASGHTGSTSARAVAAGSAR